MSPKSIRPFSTMFPYDRYIADYVKTNNISCYESIKKKKKIKLEKGMSTVVRARHNTDTSTRSGYAEFNKNYLPSKGQIDLPTFRSLVDKLLTASPARLGYDGTWQRPRPLRLGYANICDARITILKVLAFYH